MVDGQLMHRQEQMMRDGKAAFGFFFGMQVLQKKTQFCAVHGLQSQTSARAMPTTTAMDNLPEPEQSSDADRVPDHIPDHIKPLLIGLAIGGAYVLGSTVVQVLTHRSAVAAITMLWQMVFGYVMFVLVMLWVMFKLVGEVKAVIEGATWVRDYCARRLRATQVQEPLLMAVEGDDGAV